MSSTTLATTTTLISTRRLGSRRKVQRAWPAVGDRAGGVHDFLVIGRRVVVVFVPQVGGGFLMIGFRDGLLMAVGLELLAFFRVIASEVGIVRGIRRKGAVVLAAL